MRDARIMCAYFLLVREEWFITETSGLFVLLDHFLEPPGSNVTLLCSKSYFRLLHYFSLTSKFLLLFVKPLHSAVGYGPSFFLGNGKKMIDKPFEDKFYAVHNSDDL